MITETPEYYYEIEESGSGKYAEKGSKFLAYSYIIKSSSVVKDMVLSLKKANPKAAHVCYAYSVGTSDREIRSNDDGEPGGSAGLPILNEIKSREVTNILVAVVRYYGGTKLGVPGLIRAYKTSAGEAIDNGKPKMITPSVTVRIDFPMSETGHLFHVLKRANLSVDKVTYGDQPSLVTTIPTHEYEEKKIDVLARFHGYNPSEIDGTFESDKISFTLC